MDEIEMTDTTGIVTELQQENVLLSKMLALLTAGLTVNTSLLSYTVAGLPVTAPAGMLLYASNGRNPGEGGGAGTGCVVCGNGAGVWRAIWSGAAVLA